MIALGMGTDSKQYKPNRGNIPAAPEYSEIFTNSPLMPTAGFGYGFELTPEHHDFKPNNNKPPPNRLAGFMIAANLTTSMTRDTAPWRRVMSILCIVIMVLPTASWLPKSLILQFRLSSEEEVETVAETLGQTTVVRRKPLRRPNDGKRPVCRRWTLQLVLGHFPASSRGEFRFVNGTGAPLRC